MKWLLFLLAFVPSIVSTSVSGLDRQTQKALELAEVYYGAPIFVTSAYRSKEQNERVGGAVNSQHLFGRAVDVRLPKDITMQKKLIWAMIAAGFTSCGVYTTHTHFDTRYTPTFWKL